MNKNVAGRDGGGIICIHELNFARNAELNQRELSRNICINMKFFNVFIMIYSIEAGIKFIKLINLKLF